MPTSMLEIRSSQDILAFDPTKLAQLLPGRIYQDSVTGRRAVIQKTDAEDFSRLLRPSEVGDQQEGDQ